MAQFLRPSADISTTSWNGTFADIDETTASDTDFGYSNDKDNNTYEFRVTLGGVSDPLVATGHIVRCRISRSDGGVPNDNTGSASLARILLMQGATQIAEVRADATVGLWEDVSYTLTATEANNITDYTDLRVQLIFTGGAGAPNDRRGVALSWSEMEIPDAPVYGGIWKRWDGGAWVKALVKVYNGATWDQAVVQVWTGAIWEDVDTSG